ncbi:MAG TPA: class I SAM-dependent methyltransferase [Nocardioides sp.]|uniref:class I SAM-dependent methyltransferase n=1 Tax=Nocardioides sp. TaxID=35761 RepID=UPI002D8107F9|nr:class I SAM-dependent methyltransferase [Nocardioides sp.]HET6651735.1 class I SAM-dependent methyltransferase [Nocardioides sp.]
MTFDVVAEAYDRFMGRFSEPLADEFMAVAGLRPGQRVLDVGCGPGALTRRLVAALGADAVSAVDPSAPFVAAVQERCPGVDVRRASAEDLPFDADTFDVALAQLVVHFMQDPVAGLREMARVTRPGGAVLASVWDHAGDAGPLSTYWRAVRELDPGARDESGLAGAAEGHLTELAVSAGLDDVQPSSLTVHVGFATFEDWWEPYTLGVGPAGVYVAGLGDEARAALRARCQQLLPPAPFEMAASAWCVVGRVPG